MGFVRRCRIKLNVECLESRLLLVVGAGDPSIYETGPEEFTGVARIYPADTPTLTGCTGSLLATGRHILTAGHCFGSSAMEEVDVAFTLPNGTPVVYEDQDTIFIHPVFATTLGGGFVGYDLAIIALDQTADPLLERYQIYRSNNELSATSIDVVGWGLSGFGATGQDQSLYPAGIKRAGTNEYDATSVGTNPAFYLESQYLTLNNQSMLAYDFDSGIPANDATAAYAFGSADLGTPLEVTSAFGDSGGPSFINGQIAGVHSFGYSAVLTDTADDVGNSTFGEMTFDSRVSVAACWIDIILAGVNTNAPPTVTNVQVGSTLSQQATREVRTGWGHDLYDPNIPPRETALQIQTVPIALPNTVTIRFNEPMMASTFHATDFSAYIANANPVQVIQPNSVQYNSQTNSATWTFSSALATTDPKQVRFRLKSNGVTDLAGKFLDSEWTNPINTTDPNGSRSSSGNGCANGAGQLFEFISTFVPADFNVDNVVDGQDFGIWNANKFTSPVSDHFLNGDGSGDLVVDGSDFAIWNAWKFTGWTSWPGTPPGGSSSAHGSGGNVPSAGWLVRYNQVLIRYRIYTVDGCVNTGLSETTWEALANEVMALLGEL